jgi:hypothetical protein
MNASTGELLGKLLELANIHGVNSDRVRDFVATNCRENEEFAELAGISLALKEEISGIDGDSLSSRTVAKSSPSPSSVELRK